MLGILFYVRQCIGMMVKWKLRTWNIVRIELSKTQSGDVVRFSFLFILISFRHPFVLLPWPGSVEMK